MHENEESAHQSASEQNSTHTVVSSPIDTHKHSNNRTSEKDPSDCFDRRYKIASLLLLVLGAAIYYGQLQSMHDQLTLLQNEQRSWISLAADPLLDAQLTSDTVNIGMPVKFLIRNTGKNPATNTYIYVESDPYKQPSREWLTTVCTQDALPTATSQWGIGVSVFPGDQRLITRGISIKRRDISNIPGPDKIIAPTVVVCIVYKDGVTGAWHHTPYAYSLRDISPAQGHGQAVFLDELPIEAKNLGLFGWPMTFLPPD
jgi:hypothetical protein